MITDQSQQMIHWVRHYSELYCSENMVTHSALDNIECPPVMEGFNVLPTKDELSKAINSLAYGKAPKGDNIRPDLLKRCKSTLLHPLHELLCQCWKEGIKPQDTQDAKLVTLYKNKGERSDCNN